MTTVGERIQLFETYGDSQYGGEQVSQLEHALQTAALAESDQASPELIVAALLHDVGHLLHRSSPLLSFCCETLCRNQPLRVLFLPVAHVSLLHGPLFRRTSAIIPYDLEAHHPA